MDRDRRGATVGAGADDPGPRYTTTSWSRQQPSAGALCSACMKAERSKSPPVTRRYHLRPHRMAHVHGSWEGGHECREPYRIMTSVVSCLYLFCLSLPRFLSPLPLLSYFIWFFHPPPSSTSARGGLVRVLASSPSLKPRGSLQVVDPHVSALIPTTLQYILRPIAAVHPDQGLSVPYTESDLARDATSPPEVTNRWNPQAGEPCSWAVFDVRRCTRIRLRT